MVQGNSKSYGNLQRGSPKEEIISYLRERIIKDLRGNPQISQRLTVAEIMQRTGNDQSYLYDLQRSGRIKRPKSKDGKPQLYTKRDTSYLLYTPPSEGEIYVPESLEAIFNLKDGEGKILAYSGLIRRNRDGSLNGQDVSDLFNEVFPPTFQRLRLYRQSRREEEIRTRADDSVRIYFDDIEDSHPCSRQEEIDLIRRCKAGDESARDELIKANLRFVVSIANEYQNSSIPLPDLIQQGNLGLMKAIERFDETRGFKFISYGVWWIRQSIRDHLKSSSRTVRIPSNVRSNLNNINRIVRELETTSGIKVDPLDYLGLIAEELGKSEETVLRAIIAGNHELSLDNLLEEDEKRTLLSILPNEDAENPELTVTDENTRKVLLDSLKYLPPREAKILRLYYGLDNGEEPWKLEKIGERMGLTRERIRQLKNSALNELRRKYGDILTELRD